MPLLKYLNRSDWSSELRQNGDKTGGDGKERHVFTRMQVDVKIQSIKRNYDSYILSLQTQVKGLPESVPNSIIHRQQRGRSRATFSAVNHSMAGLSSVANDDHFISADKLLQDGPQNSNDLVVTRRSMTTYINSSDANAAVQQQPGMLKRMWNRITKRDSDGSKSTVTGAQQLKAKSDLLAVSADDAD